MVKLIVLYTKPEDTAAFDAHYSDTHAPLAKAMPGLRKIELSSINGSPMGDPRYYLMAELYFDDMSALNAALGSPEGKAAGKDLMGFAGDLVHMMTAQVRES